MAPRSFALPLAAIGLLLVFTGGSSSADAPQTIDSQIPGLLIGVGPAQRTLTVGWNNDDVEGCGTPVVTPSVVETAGSVTVTLVAQDGVLPAGVACGGVGLAGTVTVALAAPLAGRSVEGLQVQGGAFDWYGSGGGGSTMPDLVGLSPYDARLMLSPPPGTPTGRPFRNGPVGLVDHYASDLRAGALASVVSQKPLPGKPIRRDMIVVLKVAP